MQSHKCWAEESNCSTQSNGYVPVATAQHAAGHLCCQNSTSSCSACSLPDSRSFSSELLSRHSVPSLYYYKGLLCICTFGICKVLVSPVLTGLSEQQRLLLHTKYCPFQSADLTRLHLVTKPPVVFHLSWASRLMYDQLTDYHYALSTMIQPVFLLT